MLGITWYNYFITIQNTIHHRWSPFITVCLEVSKGTLCALTNCRTTVKWPQQERISRGHLVESLANHWSTTDGRDGRGRLEGFIKDKKLDPFHVLVGNIFQDGIGHDIGMILGWFWDGDEGIRYLKRKIDGGVVWLRSEICDAVFPTVGRCLMTCARCWQHLTRRLNLLCA